MTARERLTRKQKKTIKQQEKKARLLSRPEFKITPRTQQNIEGGETPRAIEDPGSRMQKLMDWTKENADIVGAWSWGTRAWAEEDWDTIIHPNLSEFVKLTWAEIENQRTGPAGKRRQKHHDMDICDIAREAFDRWFDLGLDEYETIFRFRLRGRARLWGYRISSKFFLVWWDKNHDIYPT